MIKVHFVEANGNDAHVDAFAGMSLMEAAVGAGVDGIEAICGGACACGTCQVYVDPSWFSVVGPPGDIEAELLEGSGAARPNSRLACQIRLDERLDGMRVEVAPAEATATCPSTSS